MTLEEALASEQPSAKGSKLTLEQALAQEQQQAQGRRDVGAMQQAGGREAQYRGLAQGSLMGIGASLAPAAFAPALSKFLPPLLSEAIPTAGGIYAGGRAGGLSHEDALKAALIGGGVNFVVGGGLKYGGKAFTGAGKFLGGASGVPESVLERTAAQPNLEGVQRQMAVPPKMHEMQLGREIQGDIETALSDKSPGRQAMEQSYKTAEQQGVRIPIDKVNSVIESSRIPNATTPGQIKANQSLENFREDLFKNYGQQPVQGMQARGNFMKLPKDSLPPGGSRTVELNDVTPIQADRILRDSRSYVRNAYTTENPTETHEAFNKLSGGIRNEVYAAMERAGSGVAGDAAKAHEYLNASEALEKAMGNKTPEAFVRSLFTGEEQNQSALDALRNFYDVAGKPSGMEERIGDLYAQKQWNKPTPQHFGYAARMAERAIGKPAARLGMQIGNAVQGQAVPFARASAATAAFLNAMRPRENP